MRWHFPSLGLLKEPPDTTVCYDNNVISSFVSSYHKPTPPGSCKTWAVFPESFQFLSQQEIRAEGEALCYFLLLNIFWFSFLAAWF